MNKKDIKVEILRIIACFAVIVYHTRTLPLLEDGTVSETAVFIECMCTICVVTFFLISGFFIYRKNNNIFKDWLYVILSYIKNLFIPGFIIGLFCIIFHEFLVSNLTIIECIQRIDIPNTLYLLSKGLTTFSANYWPGSSAHMWYIFAYGWIVLYYPITRLFLRLNKKIVYIVLSLLFIAQLYNDIIIYFDHWTFNVMFLFIPRPVIYSAWGHMLYNDIIKNKITNNFQTKLDKVIANNKILILSVLLYVVSFIGIFYMQLMYNRYVQGNHTYTSWYSLGALTLSMALCLFIYNINFEKILSDKLKNKIYFISDKTLLIFLIHFLFVVKLNTLTIQRDAQVILGTNFFTQMVYVIFYNLLIFILSFIVATFLKIVCKK